MPARDRGLNFAGMSNWLSSEEYERVRAAVPIVCVDVVPLLREEGRDRAIGLILRDTPHQGRRWCVVGGRVFRNETLAEAVARHLRHTLGNGIQFVLGPDEQPIYVSQYFTSERGVGLVDPRQHAVAMNYCIDISGPVVAQGEAHEIKWFDRRKLPAPEDFGFGQDQVVAECLKRIGV